MATDSEERYLAYLLDNEQEERSERRALEQRAAGLIGALLIALPVSGSLAGGTDQASVLGILGLIGTGAALAVALFLAGRIARALSGRSSEEEGQRSRSDLREQVSQALASADVAAAAAAQAQLVGKLRSRNQALAARIKAETGLLPAVLVVFLISLSCMSLAREPTSGVTSQGTSSIPEHR
jgi:hypothetical protein